MSFGTVEILTKTGLMVLIVWSVRFKDCFTVEEGCQFFIGVPLETCRDLRNYGFVLNSNNYINVISFYKDLLYKCSIF